MTAQRYFALFTDVNDINLAFSDDPGHFDDEGNYIADGPEQVVVDEEVLFASYEDEHWEGIAFVLFERDGKLYEVNASHCSCHGLEGQWEPEETSWVALAQRNAAWGGFAGQDTLTTLIQAHVN
jgi:hypothetical protein